MQRLMRPLRWRWSIRWSIAGLIGAMVVVFAVCEAVGWPFLARPMEAYLSEKLHRQVLLGTESSERAIRPAANATADATADASVGAAGAVRLHLLGGVRIETSRLVVGDRADIPGSRHPLLQADVVALTLRWSDLWAFTHGTGALTVGALQADQVVVHARRSADGQANWHFRGANTQPSATDSEPERGIVFERLDIRRAEGTLVDDVLALNVDFKARLDSSPTNVKAEPRTLGPTVSLAATPSPSTIDNAAFSLSAQGHWHGQPLRANLQSGSPLPLIAASNEAPQAVPVKASLDAGPTQFRFEGRMADLLRQQQLSGNFSLSGPSLARVGDALRVTLPHTPPFQIKGHIAHATTQPVGIWQVTLEPSRVGKSDIAGEVSYDKRPVKRGGGARPMLSGKLQSRSLWLTDLGPAVGKTKLEKPATAPAGTNAGRVLPQRTFDLPTLRAMDADIALAIQTLQLNEADAVRPIAPLNAQLRLRDGVLRIDDIAAGLAQGRIEGNMVLDAHIPDAPALWQAKLALSQMHIEQFVPAVGERVVPWATGRLAGRLTLQGRGRSTAEILGSADGSLSLAWTQGTLSHLAVEVAGLDIAQGLGRILRGDESLAVSCGAALLRIKNGRAAPDPAVVDTSDSTFWLEGQASLADETLDMRIYVAPKDRSPLTLRVPLVLRGTFAAPRAGVEKSALAKRLVPAALLAVVNPLAAVIPLLDGGDRVAAEEAAALCRRAAIPVVAAKALNKKPLAR